MRQRELRASDLPLSVAFLEQEILVVQALEQVVEGLHDA
jgi:hypothetical protein